MAYFIEHVSRNKSMEYSWKQSEGVLLRRDAGMLSSKAAGKNKDRRPLTGYENKSAKEKVVEITKLENAYGTIAIGTNKKRN